MRGLQVIVAGLSVGPGDKVRFFLIVPTILIKASQRRRALLLIPRHDVGTVLVNS